MKYHKTLKTPITPKTLITIATLLFVPTSYADTTDQKIITIDGREVQLNENGSWKYLSTDRFANTKDGRRIRLKEDGSWSYAGNAPLKSEEQVRTSELDIKLQKVVIETYRKKTQKSSRIKTQTVFYVQLNNSPQAKTTINIKDSDISQIEVRDNNGKNYPVLSIKSGTSKLQPGKETTLVISAEKSPSIWGNVKLMKIIFKTGTFGIKNNITLSQRTIDFENEDVNNFSSK